MYSNSVRIPGNLICTYLFTTAYLRRHRRFLWAVAFGRQHELWDGTYTLDDLLDIVELIRVKRENEYRAAEAGKER